MDGGHGRLGFLRVKEAQGQSRESLEISKTVTELFDIFYCAMCVCVRAVWVCYMGAEEGETNYISF